MSSNISFERINENYPLSGEDNDTQVFRDNFDTIKTSLRVAQEEITDLQNNVVRSDTDNDFNFSIIQRAVFQDTFIKKYDGGVLGVPLVVDYQNGSYQIFRFSADTTIGFTNFPSNGGAENSVGKVTLELYSDGTERTITIVTTDGGVAKKSDNFPDPFVLSNADLSAGVGTSVIIEVWQHTNDRIFLNYVGSFSS